MTHPSVNSIVESFSDPVERQEMLDALADQRRRMGSENDELSAELKRVRREAATIISELQATVQRLTANPADQRYWEGRYRDEAAALSRIKEETIEECARAAENPRFAGLTRVGLCKGPHWAEETGVAELMNSHARMIASAIRSLGSTGGDKDLAG